MVEGARLGFRAIHPRGEHLENEEVVLLGHRIIDHFAFQVRIALRDQRRADERGGVRRQMAGLELVDSAPRRVAAFRHRLGELHRRDADHAFPGLRERLEAVVAVADHATHQRRLEVDHRVPRLRHHVGAPPVAGREEHDGSGLEQAIDLRQG